MENSEQAGQPVGTQTEPVEMPNGLEDQQRILDRLSKELDDYFSLRGFGEMRK